MRARAAPWMVATIIIIASCGGSGPEAPPVGAVTTICTLDACFGYPEGWEIVEQTDEFVSLKYASAPDDVIATAGRVNMEGIVTADGKTWPQPVDSVVRSFWAIIDGGGAELATMDPLRDGSVKSFGTFAGGRLWYRLTPIEGRSAVGVEVRGPNSTWVGHADAILDSVTLLP